jgi:hypothetical protein
MKAKLAIRRGTLRFCPVLALTNKQASGGYRGTTETVLGVASLWDWFFKGCGFRVSFISAEPKIRGRTFLNSSKLHLFLSFPFRSNNSSITLTL